MAGIGEFSSRPYLIHLMLERERERVHDDVFGTCCLHGEDCCSIFWEEGRGVAVFVVV